jgi:hypothetical protein
MTTDKVRKGFGLLAVAVFVVVAFAAGWTLGFVSGQRLKEGRIARLQGDVEIYRSKAEDLEGTLRVIREAAAQATSTELAEPAIVKAGQ